MPDSFFTELSAAGEKGEALKKSGLYLLRLENTAKRRL
jgi:hypothetical protein